MKVVRAECLKAEEELLIESTHTHWNRGRAVYIHLVWVTPMRHAQRGCLARFVVVYQSLASSVWPRMDEDVPSVIYFTDIGQVQSVLTSPVAISSITVSAAVTSRSFLYERLCQNSLWTTGKISHPVERVWYFTILDS